jgi:hypothetical protein
VNEFLNLRCDVDEPASIRHFEPKMLGERFHSDTLMVKSWVLRVKHRKARITA